MRLEKTVDLGGFKVTIKECTIGQVRGMLRMMATAAPELKTASAENQLEMLGIFDHALSTLFEQLTDIIILPQGKTLDDLTFSEAGAVWDALVELNPQIFKKKGMEGLPEAIAKALKGPQTP